MTSYCCSCHAARFFVNLTISAGVAAGSFNTTSVEVKHLTSSKGHRLVELGSSQEAWQQSACTAVTCSACSIILQPARVC
jgi:hypothetical protein